MNQAQFSLLHGKCIAVIETYFAEARKTYVMLGNCTLEPLSFRKRFALLLQEITENDAHLKYLEAKRLLHSAALLGYSSLSRDSSPAHLR